MIAEADIKNVVMRIVALCDPDKVYLFGSHAKGNATDKSDLDLVVVAPTALPWPMRGANVRAALSSMSFSMDVLFATPSELEDELAEPYSLYSMILPTARLLYARGGVPHGTDRE
jgi:predicted nucleotidyltransferase